MTMTEINPIAAHSLEIARAAKQRVAEIDAQLDASATGELARRNAAANEIVSTTPVLYKDTPISEIVVSRINESFTEDEKQLVAAYVSVRDALEAQFGERVKAILNAQIANQPVTTLSQEERDALMHERATQAKLYSLSKETLSALSIPIPEDLAGKLPAKRSIGTRGPSFEGTYEWSVETKKGSNVFEVKTLEITDKKTGTKTEKPATLSYLANSLCKELNWSTADLKNFLIHKYDMKVEDNTVKNPPSRIEVTLPPPVDRKIVGILTSDVSADDTEDEEMDSENGSENVSENASENASA